MVFFSRAVFVLRNSSTASITNGALGLRGIGRRAYQRVDNSSPDWGRRAIPGLWERAAWRRPEPEICVVPEAPPSGSFLARESDPGTSCLVQGWRLSASPAP